MSPSDPYDDDDDFFSDPAALASLAALEEKAIAASQAAPKNRYHHTVARPAAGPRAAAQTPAIVAPVPRPLNTTPRVTGCGFGWETGGKHYMRAEQQRQQQQQQQQQKPQIKNEPLFMPRPASYDDDPVDVVVDERGQYGYSGATTAGVTAAAANTTAGTTSIAHPLQRTRSVSTEPRGPLPGSQARREAIEAARSGNNTPIPGARGPLSRSTSSTSTGGLPNPNPPALGVNRTLSRSASTGQQVFARAMPLQRSAGGGLAPISSQGTPPSSQGAAARRAVVELDEERRLREKAEAEARELRARLAELQGNDTDDLGRLRRDLYAATGQVKIVRDNARLEEDRFKEEIRRLREANQELEQRMKEREIEAKQKVESMRTQAVFSNHNALASASKARQQSQFMASQRQTTPMRGGSPLRNRTAAVTPAPLVHSVKSKPRPPPPPRFESLANAFNMTPTVTRKRQRTEAPSPVTTPKKQRSASQQSPVIVSPLASPVQSRHQSQQGSQQDMDVEMDWQPDFGEPPAPEIQLVTIEPRDERVELVHHIMMHHTLSSIMDRLEGTEDGAPVRTIVRIARSPMPDGSRDLQQWDTLAHELLGICSNPKLTFDEASMAIMATFAEMLAVASFGDIDDVDFATWLFNMIYVLRLVSSTILLFPSLVVSNPDAAKVITRSVCAISRMLAPAVQKSVEYADSSGAEMADAVVELAEAVCLADAQRVWVADQLAVVLLNLMQSENPSVVARGLDLFIVASCYQDNFQAILFPSDEFASDTPVIDRVARFLAYGHAKFTPEKFARSSLAALGGLFMLSNHDPDAIVLLTGHSMLVPSLLMVLHRESTRLWGVRAHTTAMHNPLEILLPTLTLLHHLVYPAPQAKPSASQAAPNVEAALFAGAKPQGVDLRHRLNETGSTKEFNGIQHVFVTALGAMAYADVDTVGIDTSVGGTGTGGGTNTRKNDWDAALRTVQYLAQDLLDGVVEGPEGDQVYELYADADADDEDMEGARAADEEEYGEEEAMLGRPEWAQLSQE